jgi:hypothetical protein
LLANINDALKEAEVAEEIGPLLMSAKILLEIASQRVVR